MDPRPGTQVPSARTHLFGPICKDPSARTHLQGPISPDPYPWTHVCTGPVFLDPHARTHMPGPVLGKNSVKSNYKVKIPKMTLTCFQKLNIMLNCSKLRTEQVPFPGPWVSGPRSRVEQVPFPGPGTRDPTRAIKTGSCNLLRVPSDGSQVPGPGSRVPI